MRKFLTRLSIFLLVFLSLTLSFNLYRIGHFETVVANGKSIDSADVIITGDSRADAFIDPGILHDFTGLDCINVADRALDLYSLSLRLEKLDLKDKTLLVSVSFYQVNDGSARHGFFFRPESFNELSPIEKVMLYRTSPDALPEKQAELMGHSGKLFLGHDGRFLNKGYDRSACKAFDVEKAHSDDNPHYGHLKTKGIRERLFQKGLKKINSLKCKRIILFNSPLSPSFKRISKGNGIWAEEVRFGERTRECLDKMKLSNIEFYSLIDMDAFSDSNFFDANHVCESGARIFSRLIADVFSLSSDR